MTQYNSIREETPMTRKTKTIKLMSSTCCDRSKCDLTNPLVNDLLENADAKNNAASDSDNSDDGDDSADDNNDDEDDDQSAAGVTESGEDRVQSGEHEEEAQGKNKRKRMQMLD